MDVPIFKYMVLLVIFEHDLFFKNYIIVLPGLHCGIYKSSYYVLVKFTPSIIHSPPSLE
jgi:hypothetical protein